MDNLQRVVELCPGAVSSIPSLGVFGTAISKYSGKYRVTDVRRPAETVILDISAGSNLVG
jgi:hypothetical protein